MAAHAEPFGSGIAASVDILQVTHPGPRRPRARRSPREGSGPGGMLFGPVVVLLLWELASAVGWLSPRQLAAPSTALVTGYEMLTNGILADHFLASAKRAYLGLGIGVAIGLALALISGLTRVGEASIDGLVQIKRAVPTLALIPLAILWLGIGEAMKVAIITTSVLIPSTSTRMRPCGASTSASSSSPAPWGSRIREFIRRVALPGALPGFFTGLRLSVTTCWTALVVLEQINTTEGIGYVMNRARDYGQTDVIVVGLVIYAALGLGSDVAVRLWDGRRSPTAR